MDGKPRKHAPKGPVKNADPKGGTDPKGSVPRCTARSKTTGERCKQRPIPGGTVCVYHGGKAPQVQRKAYERLRAYSERAEERLIELLEQNTFPSTALSATRDLLDRIHGKPVESLNVEHSGQVSVVDVLKRRQAKLESRGV